MTKEESDFLANCRLGNIDECRVALANGINPSCADVAGRSALEKAIEARRNNKELTKLLIEHGADTSVWPHHPLVVRFTGGPKLRPAIKTLRDSLAGTISDLEAKGMTFSFADRDEIKEYRALKLPSIIRDLYEFALPDQTPSEIQFLDPAGIEANIEAMPGSSLVKHGLIPIACDISGDNYCVDAEACESLESATVYHFMVSDYTDSKAETLKQAHKSWPSIISFLHHACLP